MNGADYNRLREALWRRRLTPEEEACLQASLAVHPEARAEAEDEAALTELLRVLPEAPVASNFTALVLEAVDATPACAPRPSFDFGRRGWLWRPAWLPRLAFALSVVTLVVLGSWQYRLHSRTQFARSVADFSKIAVMPVLEQFPKVEIFQDFEAINRLAQTAPAADLELLTALQ